MTKLSLRLAVLAAAATAVSGCSVLGIDFTDEKVKSMPRTALRCRRAQPL